MTMEHTEDNHLQEQPLFTIEHETDAPTAEAVGEVPIITIERYDVEDERQLPPAVKKRSALRTWSLRLLWFVSAAVLLVGLYAATRLYNYYYNLGVSISVSPTDNLRKLDHMRMENGPSEVLLKRDSVLGVALDIYEWHNVKAELTLAEPDTADHNVLLYTRTADYTATGEYIGSLVVDGEEKQSDVSRLGYCALKNGHAVIGISRFDDLRSAMVLLPPVCPRFRRPTPPAPHPPRQSGAQSPRSHRRRPPLRRRHAPPRNPLELRRRLARIRLRRCHLSHRR